MCDRHKDAFVALDSVASLDLRPREDGYCDRKYEHHDAYGLFGENTFDPFPEVFVQEGEKYNSCNQLRSEKRKGEVQVQLPDCLPVLHVRS